MSAESSDNWDVLLPLSGLRRLTLPERAVHDRLATATLGEMPWVPHVHYWGRTCGERAHDRDEPWRVHPWLHQLGRGPMDFMDAAEEPPPHVNVPQVHVPYVHVNEEEVCTALK